MTQSLNDQRDHVLSATLPFVAAQGWTKAAIQSGLEKLNEPADLFPALFPGGIEDLLTHFSDFLDRAMMKKLAKVKPDQLRVRDRIETGVLARLGAAEPYRDALRLALAYWSVPPRPLRAAQVVWRTADRLWNWAGDTATDYNRYTKRGLLAGVITSTTLVWIKDQSSAHELTAQFLANRIENVLELGQIIHQFKNKK